MQQLRVLHHPINYSYCTIALQPSVHDPHAQKDELEGNRVKNIKPETLQNCSNPNSPLDVIIFTVLRHSPKPLVLQEVTKKMKHLLRSILAELWVFLCRAS